MTLRSEVYKCGQCRGMAVVLRGGAGGLSCCGQNMGIYKESIDMENPGAPPPVNTPTIEHNLSMPVKTIIEIMQRRITQNSTYFGVRAIKNPLDFWVYAEIIHDLKPDFIIEIGNCEGGSILALAHLLDALGNGSIIGLDIDHGRIPPIVWDHPRIELITGDACAAIDAVKERIKPGAKVLVIEDSSHTFDNTLNVLRTFSPLVNAGSYFIVEDSLCQHGLEDGFFPGPYEAIEEFMKETGQFEIDRSKEAFFITWNPIGFLKKIR